MSNIRYQHVVIAVCLIFAFLLVGCGYTTSSEPPIEHQEPFPTRERVDTSSLNMSEGEETSQELPEGHPPINEASEDSEPSDTDDSVALQGTEEPSESNDGSDVNATAEPGDPVEESETPEVNGTPEPSDPEAAAAPVADGLVVSEVWFIINEFTEDGAEVQTWFYIDNRSNQPGEGIVLPLPAGAEDVQLNSAAYTLEEGDAQTQLVSAQPVPAQSEANMVIVEFELPRDTFDLIEYSTDYVTEDFAVYLPLNASPQWEVPEMPYEGIRLLRGLGDYLLFKQSGLQPGTPLAFSFQQSEEVRLPENIEQVAVGVEIANGTAGGIVPPDLQIQLRSYNEDGSTTVYDATRNFSALNTQFADVPVSEGGFIQAWVEYKDVGYSAEVNSDEITEDFVTLDVTIFEPTTDPSVVSLEAVWYIADAVTSEGWVEYIAWFYFQNNSDRIYVGESTETGEIFRIPLPAGIAQSQVVIGSPSATGVDTSGQVHEVVDNRPLFPNRIQQLAIDFLIPYDGETSLTHTLDFDAATVVAHTSAPRMLNFDGEGFVNTGLREIEGLGEYLSYTLEDVEAGTPITFSISDSPHTPQGSTAATVDNNTTDDAASDGDFLQENRTLILGLGVLLVVAGMGFFAYDLQKERLRLKQAELASNTKSGKSSGKSNSKKSDRKREKLVKAIAELDESYENGDLHEEEYQTRRESLKEQLRELI